jgi:hypothetical protein
VALVVVAVVADVVVVVVDVVVVVGPSTSEYAVLGSI